MCRSNFDDIVAVAIEAEFHVESISVEPQNNGPPLNDPEKDRLHELYVASRALVEPIDAEKNVSGRERKKKKKTQANFVY